MNAYNDAKFHTTSHEQYFVTFPKTIMLRVSRPTLIHASENVGLNALILMSKSEIATSIYTLMSAHQKRHILLKKEELECHLYHKFL